MGIGVNAAGTGMKLAALARRLALLLCLGVAAPGAALAEEFFNVILLGTGSPRLFERSERSERSEFCGATPGRAAQWSRSAAQTATA